MSGLAPLMRVNCRLMFAIDKTKNVRKEIAKKVSIIALLLMIAGLMAFVFAMIAGVLGRENLRYLLSSIMLGTQIYVIIFGLAQYISSIFFSKDNEFLMALPIKPHVIFMSKLLTSYLTYLALSLIMQLPSFLAAGIILRVNNANYYIFGLLGACLVPMLPLLIISVLSFPIAWFVNKLRRKGIAGTIIVTLIFAGFFAAYMYLVTKMQTADMTEITADVIAGPFKVMSYIMYPNLFLAIAMSGTGAEIWANMAYFLLVIIGTGAVAIGISMLLYRSCATRFTEHTASSKVKQGSDKAHGVLRALCMRDLKCAMSDSASAMNYLLGLVLTPISIIVLCLASGIPDGATGNAQGMVASMTALIFVFMTNYFALIPFSREGKNISLLKMLPVSNRDILRSKLILADAYTVIISVLSGLAMIASRANWLFILLFVVACIVNGIGINGYTVTRDLLHPKLDWQNLRIMIKRNMCVFYALMLAIPAIALQVVLLVLSETVGVLNGMDMTLQALVIEGPVILLGVIYILIFRLWYMRKHSDAFSRLG